MSELVKEKSVREKTIMGSLENTTHVYCTDCVHFYVLDETPCCNSGQVCDLTDCEDSKPYSRRPYYKENISL